MALFENLVSLELTTRLGWTIIHFIWQAAALALILALVFRLLQNASAHLRYAVACLVLALVVILPVATFCMISVPSGQAASVVSGFSDSETAPSSVSPVLPQTTEPVDPGVLSPISWTERLRQLADSALPCVVVVWLLGVSALSLRHLGAWIWLQGLRCRQVTQADPLLIDALDELIGKLKVSRPVRLVESGLVQIPTVIGCLRPVILLPASALTGLTTQQMEAILAHELAHVRRYDYLANLLQMVVETLGFFHPGVWWISGKIRTERENCCDDLAISVCGDARAYAQALTEMESIRCAQVELALAASGGNLLRRISRVLAQDVPHRTQRSWMQALMAVTLLLAVSVPATMALSNHAREDSPERDGLPSLEASAPLPPAPSDKVNRAQILLDCVVCEAPASLELPGVDTKARLPVLYFDSAMQETLQRLQRLAPSDERLKIIASPKVMVYDGTQGSIAIGQELPYTTEEPSGDASASASKPKTVFNGIKLDVMPKIHEDNSAIRLSIKFTASDVEWTQHPNDVNAQIPIVSTTDCSTQVMVKDKHSIVFGGLCKGQEPDKQVILLISPQILHHDQDPVAGDLSSAPDVVQDEIRTPKSNEPDPAAVDPLAATLDSQPVPRASAALTGPKPPVGLLTVPTPASESSAKEVSSSNTIEPPAAIAKGEKGLRIFTLNHIDARKLAPLLGPLVKTLSMSTAGNNRRQLVVSGSTSDMEKLESLLQALDRPDAPGELSQTSGQIVTRVYALRYADCQYVSSLLSQLLSDRDYIKLITHASTNRIVVVADPSDHQQIEELVSIIDRPGPGTETVQAQPNDAERPMERTARRLAQPSDVGSVRQRNDNATWRRQVIMQQISGLQSELLKQEAQCTLLESDISALEQSPHPGMSLQETLKMQQDYVNSDPTIKALAGKIAQVEMDLLVF